MTSIKHFTNLIKYQLKYIDKLQLEVKRKSKSFIFNQISENFYLFMSFSFSFFIYGFYLSLKSKYKDQFTDHFIKNNLPGISQPIQKLDWESVKILLTKNSEYNSSEISHRLTHDFRTKNSKKTKTEFDSFLNSPFIKKIDFYNDQINIQLNPIWKKETNQDFLGIFIENTKNEQKTLINKKWFQISIRELQNAKKKKLKDSYPLFELNKVNSSYFIDKYNNHLDQIPQKLDSKNGFQPNNLINFNIFYDVNRKDQVPDQKSNSLDLISKKRDSDFREYGKIPNFFFEKQKIQTNDKKLIGVQNSEKNVENRPLTTKQKTINNLNQTGNIKKAKKLEYEVKNLFFSKGVLPISNPKKYIISDNNIKISTSATEKKFINISHRVLLKILKTRNFESNSWIKPRKMSGYLFPDMKEHEIVKIYTHLIFKNLGNKDWNVEKTSNLDIGILLPPSCEFVIRQKLAQMNRPQYKIQYIRTILDGQKNIEYILRNESEQLSKEKIEILPISQFVYKGPGVFLNKQTNDLFLDFDTDIEKWKNIVFGPDTFFTDKKERFFGKKQFLHGEKVTERKLNEIKEQSIDKRFIWKNEKDFPYNTIPTKKEELSREFFFQRQNEKSKKMDLRFDLTKNKIYKNNTIIPTFEYSSIPYISPKNWYKIFKAQIENTINNETDLTKIKISIPSFIIGNLKNEPIYSSLSQLDYQNIYNLALQNNNIQQKQNIFHFIPWTQTTISELSIKNAIINGIYKKNLTLYKTSKQFNNDLLTRKEKTLNPKQLNQFKFIKNDIKETFQESWQSVTSESWMMIYKICFALWLQEIAKDFYKKYGKEILFYVIDLFAALGFDTREVLDQLQLGNSQNSLRIIENANKRFENVAGIDAILPELSEIVWFLRNSARGSKIPKGLLFIGPPGTGKTFLVQAIAGEAQIPVVVQSASALTDMEEKQSGSQRLKNLFEKARELAPCILFIDEIDTLGAARENVMVNTMGEDALLESIYQVSSTKELEENNFISKPKLSWAEDENWKKNEYSSQINEQGVSNIFQSHQEKNQIKQQRLALLMQFLVEMDGLKSLNGVVVIGATNRASVLDPAFIRPGRFEKILEIGLPTKQKRIDILQLYSQNLGISSNISWEYLGYMTEGLSAADLAAAMNQSSLKAILEETIHTIETIEYGINTITRQNLITKKPNLKEYKDPFFIKRLASYQAGKAIIQSLLPNHPPLTSLSLWPEKNITGFRSKKFNIENISKADLEHLIIGLYGGKAAEILTLITAEQQKTNPTRGFKGDFFYWESNLGVDDLRTASNFIISMIENWYFYSKKLLFKKTNQIQQNQNQYEIQDTLLLDLFQTLYENFKHQTKQTGNFKNNSQNWVIPCWWQEEIKKYSELSDPAYAQWYRIYLPDPEETERNEEWIPPDQYYNNTKNLQNLSNIFIKIRNNREITWNDFYQIDRDYIYQSLVNNSFNKAFCILDTNRELVDYIADYLIRFGILRQPEIVKILKEFSALNLKKPNKYNSEKNLNILAKKQNKRNSIYNFEENWGGFSRRKQTHFINFDFLKKGLN